MLGNIITNHFLRYERIRSIIILSLGRLYVENGVLKRKCECGESSCDLYFKCITPASSAPNPYETSGRVIGKHWYNEEFLSRRAKFIFLTRGI